MTLDPTDYATMLEQLEREDKALLELKQTIAHDVGSGKLPIADFVGEWAKGIDKKLENNAACRDVLRFNAGLPASSIPEPYGDLKPDIEARANAMRARGVVESMVKADHDVWARHIA